MHARVERGLIHPAVATRRAKWLHVKALGVYAGTTRETETDVEKLWADGRVRLQLMAAVQERVGRVQPGGLREYIIAHAGQVRCTLTTLRALVVGYIYEALGIVSVNVGRALRRRVALGDVLVFMGGTWRNLVEALGVDFDKRDESRADE